MGRPGRRAVPVNERRVLVACVTEDRERARREVHLLFRSLQRLGGNLARCRQIACFVEHIDERFREQLAAIDVETRIVARVDRRCPHANKIRMLMEVDAGVDWVVGLDTDVAVAGDSLVTWSASAFAPNLSTTTR